MLTSAIVFTLFLGGSTFAAEVAPVESKIVETMELASRSSPGSRAAEARLGAEIAALGAEAAPGGPSFTWQREGIDESFDWQPNGVDHFVFTKPFNWRGQHRRARELSREVGDFRGGQLAAGRLELASRAGQRWLELAASTERLELARGRLERLDGALVLERRRFELGEVAGTDLAQLELERAREASKLRTLEESYWARFQELKATAGSEFPAPIPGELEILAASTERADDDSGAELGGVLLDAARGRAALAERQAELAGATAWGRPEAGVEWQRVPSTDGVSGFDALALELTVPLPIGKAGRARQARAELEAEAARAEAEMRRLELEARVRAGRAAERAAAINLEELAPVLERLPRTEHSLSEQFRLGAISYLVLIDGLGRLDDVRLEAIDARRRLLAARLELAVSLSDPSYFPLPATTQEAEP